MAGIHLHTHDILDEGTENIYRHLAEMEQITTLFPQVNTIFERNPNPDGVLPHNPIHPYVIGQGNMYASIDVQAESPKLFQVVAEVITKGEDPLQAMIDANHNQQYRLVPWLNLFNGNFAGQIADNCIYDFRGNMMPTWLCPNAPEVLVMWTETFKQLDARYGFETYMIDRIRYPDWSDENVNPNGLFSCFCTHCQHKMSDWGLQTADVLAEMEAIASFLKVKNFAQAITHFQQSTPIKRWIQFRQESITEFLQQLKQQVQQLNQNINFWIDLWPPSYAWLLGQDYSKLTQLFSELKHFPYHKLGGGANVQGLINYFAVTEEEQEKAFQAFCDLFDIHYPISYQQFRRSGYPIRFVSDENSKARRLTQPETQIYSGIQMWNINDADLQEAIQAAKNSSADDLIYYCYGWAELRHFQVVKAFHQNLNQ